VYSYWKVRARWPDFEAIAVGSVLALGWSCSLFFFIIFLHSSMSISLGIDRLIFRQMMQS